MNIFPACQRLLRHFVAAFFTKVTHGDSPDLPDFDTCSANH
jgi:hypothetical protein